MTFSFFFFEDSPVLLENIIFFCFYPNVPFTKKYRSLSLSNDCGEKKRRGQEEGGGAEIRLLKTENKFSFKLSRPFFLFLNGVDYYYFLS